MASPRVALSSRSTSFRCSTSSSCAACRRHARTGRRAGRRRCRDRCGTEVHARMPCMRGCCKSGARARVCGGVGGGHARRGGGGHVGPACWLAWLAANQPVVRHDHEAPPKRRMRPSKRRTSTTWHACGWQPGLGACVPCALAGGVPPWQVLRHTQRLTNAGIWYGCMQELQLHAGAAQACWCGTRPAPGAAQRAAWCTPAGACAASAMAPLDPAPPPPRPRARP